MSQAEVSSRSNVAWDASPAPVRLNRALNALASYAGDDAYLKHMRDGISATLAGIEWDEQRVVTAPALPGDSQAHPLPGEDSAWRKLMQKLKKLKPR